MRDRCRVAAMHLGILQRGEPSTTFKKRRTTCRVFATISSKYPARLLLECNLNNWLLRTRIHHGLNAVKYIYHTW